MAALDVLLEGPALAAWRDDHLLTAASALNELVPRWMRRADRRLTTAAERELEAPAFRSSRVTPVLEAAIDGEIVRLLNAAHRTLRRIVGGPVAFDRSPDFTAERCALAAHGSGPAGPAPAPSRLHAAAAGVAAFAGAVAEMLGGIVRRGSPRGRTEVTCASRRARI